MTEVFSEEEEARLERLSRLAARLLSGRPLHHEGRLVHSRPGSSGLEFADYRAMIPGDDPKHLDWRASARSRHPLVRQYRNERAGEWVIFLDRSASMAANGGVWSLARQLAIALAFLLLNLEHRVGLALFSAELDRYLPPGRGRPTYLTMRRALGSISPLERGGASRLDACLQVLPRSGQVVVISDFLAPDAMKGPVAGITLRSRAVHLLHIQGPAPALSPDIPAVVEDVESGERLITRVDETVSAGVMERMRMLARDLEQFCRNRGAAYSAVPVGKNWEEVLLDHLVRPEARLA
jgi:uncharacterized protein (DUF58 family)